MEKDAMLYVIVLLAAVVLTALIVLGYVTTTSIRSQGGTTSTIGATNQLSISASGTASNSSTQAQLFVTVNGTGKTSAAAVSNLSIALGKFNSTIYKYVDGNLSMITTSYYNVYKNYNYPCIYPSGAVAIPCRVSNSTNSTANNYTAQESITVKIPNISNVSSLLLATSQIPGVYVTSAQPILSDAQISMLRTQALSLALANATSQARALIGTNNTIVNTNITVNSYYLYPYATAGGAVSAAASNGSAGGTTSTITIGPQFYGGTNKVTESITAVFYYGKK